MGLLLFKKKFWEAIRAGRKRTTIRRWRRARLVAGARAFASGVGWVIVEAVEIVKLNQLTDHDAMADGFASRRAMAAALWEMYPAKRQRDGRQWYRVRFRLDERRVPAPRANRPVKAKPARRRRATLPRGCASHE